MDYMDYDRDLPKWLDQLGRLLRPQAVLGALGLAWVMIPTLLALAVVAFFLVR